MVFLDPVLNPLMKPLLALGPLWAVVVLSFLISVIIVLVYKFFTKQDEMKRLKEQQKEFQKRMKELRSNPDEMMKVQKEAMKANMEYMKHSFKATLITMLPVILIFGWMNAHLAYEPIYPGETYSVTAMFNEGVSGEAELIFDEGSNLAVDKNIGKTSEVKQKINSGATWYVESTAGEHFLTVKFNEIEQSKKVLVTTELKYEEPISVFGDSGIKQIRINNNKLRPLGPNFTVPLFNWQPGWLGIYIILSIVFSIVLRKLLKVY